MKIKKLIESVGEKRNFKSKESSSQSFFYLDTQGFSGGSISTEEKYYCMELLG